VVPKKPLESHNTVYHQLRGCRLSICQKNIKLADSGRHIESPKSASGTQER